MGGGVLSALTSNHSAIPLCKSKTDLTAGDRAFEAETSGYRPSRGRREREWPTIYIYEFGIHRTNIDRVLCLREQSLGVLSRVCLPEAQGGERPRCSLCVWEAISWNGGRRSNLAIVSLTSLTQICVTISNSSYTAEGLKYWMLPICRFQSSNRSYVVLTLVTCEFVNRPFSCALAMILDKVWRF